MPVLVACANVIVFALAVTRALIRASAKGNARKQQGNKIAEHPYEETKKKKKEKKRRY